MPPRTISFLCLLQVLGLLGAGLFANWLLKGFELSYGIGEVTASDWGNRMKAMRSWGLILFLVPAATAFFCARLAKTYRDIPVIGPDGLWLAILVTVGILWFCSSVMFTAMSGPPRKPKFLGLSDFSLCRPETIA